MTQQLSSYPTIPANLVIVSYLDLAINNPFSGISFPLNSLLHGWKKEAKITQKLSESKNNF